MINCDIVFYQNYQKYNGLFKKGKLKMPLHWDKIEKVQTTEQWAENGFEDGPRGGYVPNMNQTDMERWKAKLVGANTNTPQVEIRKSNNGVQLLMIVSLGEGYRYKTRGRRGVNVHLALNGGAQLTFAQMDEMHECVGEARDVLQRLRFEKQQTDKQKLEIAENKNARLMLKTKGKNKQEETYSVDVTDFLTSNRM